MAVMQTGNAQGRKGKRTEKPNWGGGQLLTSAEAELEEDGMRGTGGETARSTCLLSITEARGPAVRSWAQGGDAGRVPEARLCSVTC